jgi:hypothetical protein
MRRAMINSERATGSKVLPILQHFDDMVSSVSACVVSVLIIILFSDA